MKLSKLRRKLRRQIRRERLEGKEKLAVKLILNDDEALEVLNQRIETEVNPWNQQGLIRGEWNWSEWFANVWDWFVANWPAILKIILTIAPLLLLETKNAKNQ